MLRHQAYESVAVEFAKVESCYEMFPVAAYVGSAPGSAAASLEDSVVCLNASPIYGHPLIPAFLATRSDVAGRAIEIRAHVVRALETMAHHLDAPI